MEAIKKFKEQLSALADAVREKTGRTETMSIDELVEEITWLDAVGDDTQTYILVDGAGNEIPAAIVDEPVTLTATANDIRIGTTAVTDDGVIEGEKEIPSYQTYEGYKVIEPGSPFELDNFKRYDYTKLQAIMCEGLVAAQQVCINDKVYSVGSTSVLSEVTLDHDRKAIVFGITNEGSDPCVIRYFTYKEEP